VAAAAGGGREGVWELEVSFCDMLWLSLALYLPVGCLP